MNTKMKMRTLSLLLCFVMLVGLVPTTVFAWTAPTLSGNRGDAWNIQLSDEGVLSWNTISEATSYDIYVDKTAMGGTVTKIQGVTGTSYNLINRFKELKLENGTYYFQIKANGPNTTSSTIRFNYVSPQDKLSEPRNLRWEGTIAKWDSVANATGYEVKLYTDDGYLQLSKTATTTQYDWTTEAADGRWFEVVATADNYRDSNPAEGPKYGTYSWTAPTLTGGKAEWNVQLSDDGMLKWNDMGSATYDIEVEKTAMGGTVTNIYSINTNTYNLINRFKTLKLENGTYYFTIKANDTSETSGTIRFNYVSPESKLSAPQNLRWDGTVAKWDSVANATGYTVILYTSSGSVQLSKTTSETQYNWDTEAADGRWFKVVATADNYRDSNAAESPKYSTPLVPNTYTVTYDANGGTGTMASENLTVDGGFAKNYTFPQCGFTAPDGKEFDKWQWYYNSDPSQTTDTTPGNSPWLSGSITVKALWKDKSNTYTVTYNANGGSGSMGTEYITFENDGFAKTYTFPKCGFTAPSGKEFDKWQWYYNSNPSQTTDTTPGNSPWLSGSITVKALWKDVLNDIFTSQPTNISGKIGANIKVSVGIDITQVPNENTAYIVLEVQNGGNWDKVAESNRSNWGGSFDVSSNTACTKTYRYKVYNGAQWNESDTFTVEFQPLVVTFVDNEHSTQTEPINVTTCNTTIAKPNNPTYAGDTFYGWNWPYWNFQSDVVTQDITLYAQWAGRGFYGDIPNVSAKVGEKARIILSNVNYNNSPTYVYKYDGANWVQVVNVTNYGWYDLPASAVEKTETYKIVISHSRNIESNEFTVTWSNSTHTVSFNANGGSGTMNSVEYAGAYTLPTCMFTAPADKQFKGWATSANGNVIDTATYTVTADVEFFAIWEAIPQYNVVITAGTGMSTTGNANQTVGQGSPITSVVYTAADGYYFPTNYSVAEQNGISVTRNSYTQITVSGTPTAAVNLTLTAATAKTQEATPSASFTATGPDTGTLSGVTSGMKYSTDGGNSWTNINSNADINLTGLSACTISVVKTGDGNTTTDSNAQSITVTKAAAPTTVVGVACTTGSNDDGKLQNVTTAMEYKLSTANNWTDGTGSDVTSLANGIYYVRVKASGTVLASDYQTVNVPAYSAVPTYGIDLDVNNTYSFDAVTVGYAAIVAKTVTVINTGNSATGALTVALSGSNANSFELNKTSIGDIAVSGSDTFTVVPKTGLSAGTYTATVTVSGGNSINASFNVSFTVNAASPTYSIALSPSGTQTFTAATVGYGAQTAKTITVNNTGTGATGALTVALSGSNANSFELNKTSIGDIAVSGSDTFTVVPKTGLSAGTYTATVTVSGNNSITASFDVSFTVNPAGGSGGGGGGGYTYYTIKATAGVNGSISPTGSVSVREGRDQIFTITPDKGYAVSNVKIDGKSIGAVRSYTFENVRKTHTIEVIFMKANGNPQTGVFVDVATGSYYEDAVDWAVENGITKGTDDTHFSPDGICTRAQAVTFLWRAAGSPAAKSSTMPFTDVKAGSYYYDAVLWAVENGITKGTSDTMFSPDANCSRAQIVTFLWRSQKSPAAGTANPFADVKSTAYYADAVLWAVKEDITKGTTNTTFSPDADCTRAQIVTFLWRALAE